MASIYNTDPNLTYTCLLNLGTTNGVGNTITSSLQTVLDGQGNASGLQISSTGVGFTSATIGNITLNGNTISTTSGAISINSFNLTNNLGTTSGSTVNIGTVGASTVNIGATGGTVVFAGSVSGLSFTSLSTANINIDVTAKTINTTATNGTLTLSGNGTGRVLLGQATSLGVELVADQPIQDSSGNNYISFSKTSTAVNYVTITNQATGTGPTIAANGSDGTVDLFLKPKSTGKVKVGTATLAFPNADGASAGCAMTTNGSAVLGFTANPVITQVKVQIFTSSGTYTPTTGMVYCQIECIGGGGGGAGCTCASSSNTGIGGAGGSGAYSKSILSAATVGSSQTVTIGAGGTAGTAGGNGGTGGSTSVGTLVVAVGGGGGTALNNYSTAAYASAASGAGGAAGSGTGTVKFSGNTVTPATAYPTIGYIVSGANSILGYGGGAASTFLTNSVQAIAGVAGTANTGGGASSSISNQQGSGSVLGAAGGSGIVIITEYLAV